MNIDPERDDEIGGTNRLSSNTGQATDLQGKASKMAGDLQEKASGMLSAAKEKLGTVGESARSAASAARERAESLYGDARESAQEVYERARVQMTHWSEDGMQYVRENPAKSVFTALLAGVVLGFTLRRH